MKRVLPLLAVLMAQSTARAAEPAGYLFATFKGEQTPMTEQVYFALSKDGRQWDALHGGEPVLVSHVGEQGVRDPYLLRSRDGHGFLLLATDLSIHRNGDWHRAQTAGSRSIVVWQSPDLVTWSEPRLVRVAAEDAGCTWAPEAIYDEESRDYLVYWASKNRRDEFAKQRIWAARTKDFRTFTEPFVFIDKQNHVIDTTIVRDGGKFFRFSKDDQFKAITMETSDSLTGSWAEVPGFSLARMQGYEGPECYLLKPPSAGKPATWCLVLDHYTKGAGYQPFVTEDLASGRFTPGPGFRFPFRFRHGSILPLTDEEYRKLERASAKPAASGHTPPPPVLPGVNADPHIAAFGDAFYLYPTTDGSEGWRSTSFSAWSSRDLVNWKNEGVILDLPRDLKWANLHAWAPAIATKNGKFFYYYSAAQNIGVAVADTPAGPFKDPLGKPLVAKADFPRMQAIDPMVFVDDDGAAYLYWGQGRCKAVKLNDDMISFDKDAVRDLTPPGYNEGPFLHKRDGRYYLTWSEFDTRDPRYSVAYATAASPLGPFTKAADNPILHGSGEIKGAGHHSITRIPGRDEWVIAYHRFRIPDGDGYHRETCLSPLRHGTDGRILPVDVFEPARLHPPAPAAAPAPPPPPQPATSVSVDLSQPGKPVSPDLLGIFFEDISYAADGGLYAELVQNRSFEYSPLERNDWNPLTAWEQTARDGARGSLKISDSLPLHPNNRQFVVVETHHPGAGFGLSNTGFDGIPARAGEPCDFSVFARHLYNGARWSGDKRPGPARFSVRLESKDGESLAEAPLEIASREWTRLTTSLTPSKTDDSARLVLLSCSAGAVALDEISLFPRNTFKRRPNGLRADLAQTIADLKPKFMRFPGGCLVHGYGLGNMYRWQDTVGPVEQRRGQPNIWGYHQSVGLGYFEFFQFCEDIGAKPLPVVAAGVSCQNADHQGGTGQRGLPLEETPAYIQEVLDLIEWANGPATSKWGAVRAAAGHPAPFGLQYLGIGNEDHISPAFKERFRMIHDAVKAKHPEITVIGTVGPFPAGEDFENGWKFAGDLRLPMVDEHYYQPPRWFWDNLTRYDGYDRSKSKVYVGEYAAHDDGRRTTLRSALAEAAFLTSLERNADVVPFASYAPLLARRGHTHWNPNLIYFSNTEIVRTVNYHVQRLFGENAGDRHLTATVKDPAASKDFAMSAMRDTKSGDLILKFVNGNAAPKPLRVQLAGTTKLPATATRSALTSIDPLATNDFGHPDSVVPRTEEIPLAAALASELPPHSLTVIRIKR